MKPDQTSGGYGCREVNVPSNILSKMAKTSESVMTMSCQTHKDNSHSLVCLEVTPHHTYHVWLDHHEVFHHWWEHKGQVCRDSPRHLRSIRRAVGAFQLWERKHP